MKAFRYEIYIPLDQSELMSRKVVLTEFRWATQFRNNKKNFFDHMNAGGDIKYRSGWWFLTVFADGKKNFRPRPPPRLKQKGCLSKIVY